jgi:gamma-glutamyltranspeptidase/glutathione hydrolase
MEVAYLQFGSRAVSWDQLLAPAVRLARQGFCLNEYLAEYFHASQGPRPSYPALPDGSSRPGYPALLEKLQGRKVETEFVFPHGQERQAGSLVVQSALADTLLAIAAYGADAFYTGDIAARIAADFAANGGYIDEQDLAEYDVRVGRALEVTTRRGSLRIGPPPSAGMQLAQMIALVEYLGVPLRHNSAEYIDRLARIMQATFYDQRFVKTWQDGVSESWDTYLSSQRIASLAASIESRSYTSSPSGIQGTTHVTTCDEHSNAVSLTHSIGSIAGAGIMTEDLGFFYNNFLGHLNPCQGSPDSITPGARIGSLCPAIWTQNGSLRLALGSPGGSRLTTSTLQTVLNHLWFGFSIQTAVSLPRFHAEEKNLLHMESALRTREGIALSGLGYTLLDSTYVGRVQAIARLGQDLIPGADPRGGMGVQIV